MRKEIRLRYTLAVLLMLAVAGLATVSSGAAPARSSAEPAPGYQFDPAIAFNGATSLVVWTDTRNVSTFKAAGNDAGPPPPVPPPPPPPPSQHV